MATYVTKDDVKSFIKDVVKRLNVDHDAKYAVNSTVNTVKGDLDSLEDKVAQINTDNFVEKDGNKQLSTEDFTTEEKKLLAELAKDNSSAFTAEDVDDIFS